MGGGGAEMISVRRGFLRWGEGWRREVIEFQSGGSGDRERGGVGGRGGCHVLRREPGFRRPEAVVAEIEEENGGNSKGPEKLKRVELRATTLCRGVPLVPFSPGK